MKKILIIITIFILAMFLFYQINEYEESELVHSVKKTKGTFQVLSQKNERFIVQKEITIEKEIPFVDIGLDRNISRDSTVTLSATLKNIKEPDRCNYFWREDGEIIGMGASIETSFSKGEHRVDIQVVDSEGGEVNNSIKITAWDYKKIKKDHYSISTGEYIYTGWDILDHNGKYLVTDDGIFSKYTFIYNEEGRKIESTTEYYNYPTENLKKLYTYDENGNIETIEILNCDDVMIQFHTYTYDEEGNQISAKSGNSEYNLTEDEVYVYSEPSTESNSTDDSSTNIYNENGLLVYNREDYTYFTEINRYSYSEEGKLIKSITSTIIGEGNESQINIYDENGTIISNEIIYKDRGETACHYSTKLTYNKENYISTKTNKVLEGNCGYAVEAEYISYTYDNNGNVTEIKSKLSLEEDSSREYTTLKTKIYYSNELEE